jgi:type VI secretion system protein ImpK
MRGIGQPPGTMGASPFGGASMATPQPAQTPAQPHKIDLSVALAAKDFPPGALKNPLVAQAAKLLILFGRLRMQVVAMEAQPLLMHVFQEIKNYGEALRRAGMDPQEVSWGQYFLAATADDIVQNLPGPDRHLWLNASMTAQFFQDRTSGTRFFQEVERLLTIPAQGFRLLELALLCLSLGFEGRYRSEPNGSVALQRFREAIYESLRRIEARPDEDISPRWQPMLMGGKQKIGGAWVLALVGLLAAGLVGGYITLRTLLSTQSGEAVAKLALMVTHPVDDKVEAQKITLVRPVVVDDQPASGTDIQAEPDPGPIVADTAPPKTLQADRINQALAEEIAAGKVTVTQKGSYIDIALTADSLPFASGRADIAADLGTDLEVLAAKLGTLIDAEQGPVKIVGYTDTVGLRATNKFKNNQLLSTARATSVLTMLSAHVADPGRLTAEGRGEADALGDNKTKEGQRQNRRVEIWLLREEML